MSPHTSFVRSNKLLSFSQTPKVSLSKVEIIEEESPPKEWKRVWELYILSDIFIEILCPKYELNPLALWERYEKKRGLSSLLRLKCSTSSYSHICESVTSKNYLYYVVTWPWLWWYRATYYTNEYCKIIDCKNNVKNSRCCENCC